MWRSVPTKLLLSVVAALAVGAFVVYEWLAAILGISNGATENFRLLGGIVFVLETAFPVIFNWFWKPLWKKFPLLAKLSFPDISGTWAIEIRWREKDGSVGLKAATIKIVQNWLRFRVELTTGEATSKSVIEWVEKDSDLGTFTLGYVYGHVPNETGRSGNPQHDGTAEIVFRLDEPNVAKGSYYTNRKTTGDMTLSRTT